MARGTPQVFHSAAQVGELDRRAIEDQGIDGYRLMTRAAEAAFECLRLRWPSAGRLAVACGGGNNGGDGLVIARLARAAGFTVDLGLSGDPERLRGSAAQAWADWNAPAAALDELALDEADVVVDALLGTGLDRPVRGAIATAIEAINRSGRPTLAVDIPSGLAADSGGVLGTAVRADLTVSFIGAKRGLYTGPGVAHAGTVIFDDLDVPGAIREGIEGEVVRFGPEHVGPRLPPRARHAHKGEAGHVLIVGGGPGFAGAARLAGEAALRAGAGLVSVATRPEHVAAVVAGNPALMAHGVDEAAGLDPLLERCDVVAVGPGLGRDTWARGLWQRVLEAAADRLVLDADGLNLLADDPGRLPAETVLTPHPGEAARLLGETASEVQDDRFAALARLTERCGGTVLLKGPGTLVGQAGQARQRLLPGSRPALAVGGSGDVLTGIVAGLRAQGGDPVTAACCGAALLSEAGRLASRERAVRSVIPTDLLAALGRALADPLHG